MPHELKPAASSVPRPKAATPGFCVDPEESYKYRVRYILSLVIVRHGIMNTTPLVTEEHSAAAAEPREVATMVVRSAKDVV